MNNTIAGGGTLWAAATQAISAFTSASSSNGLGIGIQYFAVPSGTSDSCTASDYATPDVAVGTLPAVGPSIIASMNAHTPSTSNALAPAIEGAISYAKTVAQSNPTDAVGVVVLTNNVPGECTTDLSAIGTLAAAGLPRVHTFIVGLGSATAPLSSVAQAGGTNAIFSIDLSQSVSQQIQQALGQIATSAALSCVP